MNKLCCLMWITSLSSCSFSCSLLHGEKGKRKICCFNLMSLLKIFLKLKLACTKAAPTNLYYGPSVLDSEIWEFIIPFGVLGSSLCSWFSLNVPLMLFGFPCAHDWLSFSLSMLNLSVKSLFWCSWLVIPEVTLPSPYSCFIFQTSNPAWR